jgi:hypothetical protein
MKTYWIGFYTSNGKDKIKGLWKLSEEEVQTEADSYLYKVKLGYTLTAKAHINEDEVKKIGGEHHMSVMEVLDCI